MEQREIIVIGAGLAGLSAAWELGRLGVDCLVLEAEAEPGGRARSVEQAGAVFDLGAWTFTHGSPAHSLAMEMGLGQELCSIPATVGRFRKGRLCAGRLDRPWTLLGGVVPWSRLPQAIKLRLVAGSSQESGDESAAHWASRRLPQDMAADLLSPLAGLYFLQDLDNLSRNELLGTISYLSKARLMGFKRGMGSWADWLARQADVRCGHRAQALEWTESGVSVRCQGMDAVRARGVILALPLPKTLELMKAQAPEKAAVGNTPYASTLAVRFLLKERWPESALQVLPPLGRERVSCGLAMERAKHPARVPQGHEALCMYSRPAAAPGLLEMSEQAILDRFTRELAEWLGRKIEPVAAGVSRWPLAAALCDPGARDRAEQLSQYFKHMEGPVWVAGDFLGSSSVSGAVETGLAAARAAYERMEDS